MVVFSKLTHLVVPEHYGFVVLSGLGHVILNFWLAYRVARARKTHEIEYPTMYSADNQQFNCVQRAHQNTLENYPTFLFLLLISGLQWPKLSAGSGLVYLIGRVVYAKGYYTGEPKNRRWGAFSHLSELVLLGGAISWCAHQLGWCGTEI